MLNLSNGQKAREWKPFDGSAGNAALASSASSLDSRNKAIAIAIASIVSGYMQDLRGTSVTDDKYKKIVDLIAKRAKAVISGSLDSFTDDRLDSVAESIEEILASENQEAVSAKISKDIASALAAMIAADFENLKSELSQMFLKAKEEADENEEMPQSYSEVAMQFFKDNVIDCINKQMELVTSNSIICIESCTEKIAAADKAIGTIIKTVSARIGGDATEILNNMAKQLSLALKLRLMYNFIRINIKLNKIIPSKKERKENMKFNNVILGILSNLTALPKLLVKVVFRNLHLIFFRLIFDNIKRLFKFLFKVLCLIIGNVLVTIFTSWIVFRIVLKKVFAPIIDKFTEMIASIKAFIKSAWYGVIKPLFIFLYDNFAVPLFNLASECWSVLVYVAHAVYDEAKNMIMKMIDVGKHAFEIIKHFYDGIMQEKSTIWDALKELYNKIKDTITGFLRGLMSKKQAIADSFTLLVNNVKRIFKNLMDGLSKYYKPMFDKIQDFKRLFNDMLSKFMAGYQAEMKARMVDTLGFYQSLNESKAAFKEVADTYGKIKDSFFNVINDIHDGMKENLDDVIMQQDIYMKQTARIDKAYSGAVKGSGQKISELQAKTIDSLMKLLELVPGGGVASIIVKAKLHQAANMLLFWRKSKIPTPDEILKQLLSQNILSSVQKFYEFMARCNDSFNGSIIKAKHYMMSTGVGMTLRQWINFAGTWAGMFIDELEKWKLSYGPFILDDFMKSSLGMVSELKKILGSISGKINSGASEDAIQKLSDSKDDLLAGFDFNSIVLSKEGTSTKELLGYYEEDIRSPEFKAMKDQFIAIADELLGAANGLKKDINDQRSLMLTEILSEQPIVIPAFKGDMNKAAVES